MCSHLQDAHPSMVAMTPTKRFQQNLTASWIINWSLIRLCNPYTLGTIQETDDVWLLLRNYHKQAMCATQSF